MGNNSSACPDIGLLRCDCGYQHGRVDGDNGSAGSSTAPLFSSPEPTPPPSKPVPWLPPPRFGKLITMLSIDGGGIRGLIPAVIVGRLEEKLQAVDGADARIADYFDVIAGTSTGALIAAMLVTPNEHWRPKFTSKQIEEFYVDNGPRIFPPKWWSGPLGMVRAWWGPKYDGKLLRQKIREVTSKTFSHTVTNYVVPTFDVHRLEPVMFYALEYQQKTEREIKRNLPDVCIGTSAAPTYFPAHSFVNSKQLEYHLIDGGVVANNPTMAAITTVTREQLNGNEYFHPGVDYKKYLVISIGTGSAVKGQGLYTAPDCAKWGALNWIYNRSNSHNPIIDIFQHGSAVLVDWQVQMLLYNTDKPKREQNYLRIQAQAPLFGQDMLPMDAATPANMDKLVDIGNKLLKEKVAMVGLKTGRYNTCIGQNVPCNDDELERFAKLLSAERKLRLENEQKKSLLTKLKSLLHYIDITKAFTSSPPPLPCSSATTSISPAAHSQMPATEEEELLLSHQKRKQQ